MLSSVYSIFAYTAALDKRLSAHFISRCTSTQQPAAGHLFQKLHYVCLASLQAVAAVREEDLMLLGVLPGHARRMLLRLPSLRAAAIPVDGGAAAAAANNPA